MVFSETFTLIFQKIIKLNHASTNNKPYKSRTERWNTNTSCIHIVIASISKHKMKFPTFKTKHIRTQRFSTSQHNPHELHTTTRRIDGLKNIQKIQCAHFKFCNRKTRVNASQKPGSATHVCEHWQFEFTKSVLEKTLNSEL